MDLRAYSKVANKSSKYFEKIKVECQQSEGAIMAAAYCLD